MRVVEKGYDAAYGRLKLHMQCNTRGVCTHVWGEARGFSHLHPFEIILAHKKEKNECPLGMAIVSKLYEGRDISQKICTR